jgi:hypothetical protein
MEDWRSHAPHHYAQRAAPYQVSQRDRHPQPYPHRVRHYDENHGVRHYVERKAPISTRLVGSITPRSLLAVAAATPPTVAYVALPDTGTAVFDSSLIDPRRLRLWLADVIMGHTARDILKETPALVDDVRRMPSGTYHFKASGCALCRDQVYIIPKHVKVRPHPNQTINVEFDGVWWLPKLQMNRLYIVNGARDFNITVPHCAVVCILSTKRGGCGVCNPPLTNTPVPSPSPSTSISPSPSPSSLSVSGSIASPSPVAEDQGDDPLDVFMDEAMEGLEIPLR